MRKCSTVHTQKGRLFRSIHGTDQVQLTSILHEGRLVTKKEEFLPLLASKYAETMLPLRQVDLTEPPPWEPRHPRQQTEHSRLDPYEMPQGGEQHTSAYERLSV